MPGRADIDTWATARWRRAATAWLDEQLDSQGIRRTGDVEQLHLRPWATVLSTPTTAGRVWLKALGRRRRSRQASTSSLRRAALGRVLGARAGWAIQDRAGPRRRTASILVSCERHSRSVSGW
jgi:hypothetical protein